MAYNSFPINSTMAISEIIITEKFAIFLRNDNILQVQIADGIECDDDDMKHIINNIAKICDGKKYPLIAFYGSLDTLHQRGWNSLLNTHIRWLMLWLQGSIGPWNS
jgi:hypothetical protein